MTNFISKTRIKHAQRMVSLFVYIIDNLKSTIFLYKNDDFPKIAIFIKLI